jgi:uncharacterized membrane protein
VDTASTIIFLAVALGVLFVAARLDKIDRLMENTFSHKAILHATELRDILLIVLALILAALVGAISMLNWVGSLTFTLIAVVITIFILYLRHKSEYRRQWSNAQSMKNLTALIESTVEKAVEKALDKERQKTHEANHIEPKDNEKGDKQ